MHSLLSLLATKLTETESSKALSTKYIVALLTSNPEEFAAPATSHCIAFNVAWDCLVLTSSRYSFW